MDVDKSDDALVTALQDGPLSIGVAASFSWQFYQGGVMKYNSCPNGQLDHGVVLVGYTQDAWIVRNSWGPSWGEKG